MVSLPPMKTALLLLLLPLGSAADERAIFEDYFHRHYQARQCGSNTLGLARAIRERTGSASCFQIVTLENRGLTVFGMVNAEHARGERFRRPAAVEANWYHHVFLVDARGFVYDSDFGTEPTVVPLAEYVERMFLDEAECAKPQYGEFCAGRDKKLADYELTVADAEEALTQRKPATRKLPLAQAAEIVPPHCR